MKDLVIDDSKFIQRMIDEINESSFPVILYGTSAAAYKIYDILIRNNVDVDYVAISEQFYNDNSIFTPTRQKIYR